MKRPTVSVIVAAFNSGRYISETIQSALNQTFDDFELILVNDGSSDDTADVIQNFHDERILFLSQGNSGPAAARNRGIASSSGKYISLLDNDDVWHPEYLSTLVEFLELNPQVAVAFADAEFFGASKFAGRRFQEVYPPCVPISFAKLALMTSHVGVFATFRRVVIDRVGLLDETLLGVDDFDFWLRALHAGFQIEPVPQVLVRYRRHASSLSMKKGLHEGFLQVLEKWLNHPALSEEEMKAVENSYRWALWQLDLRAALGNIRSGNYALAREELRRVCAYKSKLRYQATRFGLEVAPEVTGHLIRKFWPK